MKEPYENEDGTWKTWYWVMFMIGIASIMGLSIYLSLQN